MQTPPLSALFDQWQNYQKAYMDTWQNMAGPATPTSPWSAAMDSWWQSVSGQTTPENRDMYSILLKQGKSFFDMAATLNGSFTEAFAAGNDSAEWETVISRSFDGLRKTLASGSSSVPMEFWKKLIEERFQVPADMVPEFVRDFQASSEKILKTPGVGQAREQQAQLQHLVGLGMEFQNACGEYVQVQNKISNLSVDLLQKRVGEMFEQNKYPDSFRAIYDLWVDCYEDVYAEAVMEPEYNTAYGNMVNSMMALTKAQREIQDDTFEMMGMPTRRELDTLLKRFQEERRERHRMRAEIDTLKEQIRTLTETRPAAKKAAASSTEKPRAATTRRTTTRRKSTTKTAAPKSSS